MKKENKIQQIEKLTEGFKESQAVIFADYSGLSVAEMTNLRGKLSQLEAELKVAKNTLIKLAAKKAKIPLAELLGPTSILLSRGADPIASIKTFVSSFGEKGMVKFGVFEGNLLDAAEVLELAYLPTKAVLEHRLVRALNAPLTKFAFTLKGSQQSLVAVLAEVMRNKGGEAA